MIASPCYIKLLENLQYYLSQEIKFIDISKYDHIEKYKKEINKNFPIGVLGNEIEIHFLHYESEQEAYEKWTRRVKRIDWNNIFLKFDSNKSALNDELLKRFDLLQYPKVLFGSKATIEMNSLVKVDEWNVDAVKFFYISLKKFDVIAWLNRETGKVSLLNKVFYYLFHKKNILSGV